jgi:hypothetical protein
MSALEMRYLCPCQKQASHHTVQRSRKQVRTIHRMKKFSIFRGARGRQLPGNEIAELPTLSYLVNNSPRFS